MITALVLTLNEEKHLSRCLKSITEVVDKVVVIDSYSDDKTTTIARDYGAEILQHNWTNYASQFNWGIDQLPSDTDWILRIDADEYLSPELVSNIKMTLPGLSTKITGAICNRRISFQSHIIRFGGLFPVKVLRIFRHGCGKCENRWMDEHIKVTGEIINLSGDIIDENLNSLTWWTDKHNRYASREAVDLLNLEYEFIPFDSISELSKKDRAVLKRWAKENIYAKLPGGLRAFTYFIYRYVIRFGFLDGKAGMNFHFLQGFWYRYLVDAKIAEVRRHMKNTGCSIVDAIRDVLAIDLEIS